MFRTYSRLATALSLTGLLVAGAAHIMADPPIRADFVETSMQEKTPKETQSFDGIVAAFSPDGKRLATLIGGKNQSIHLWDLTTGKELAKFPGHGKAVRWIALSPDGKVLAAAGLDRTIMLWDLTTKQEKATLRGHTDSVEQVVFASNGKFLVSAGGDDDRVPGMVKIWDATDGSELATIKAHAKGVLCVAVSPDNKTLATGGDDGIIKVWNIGAGFAIAERAVLSGYLVVKSLAFSPDGKRLASAGLSPEEDHVRLWDLDRTPAYSVLENDGVIAYAVAFSKDGSTVVTGGPLFHRQGAKTIGLSGYVKSWDLATNPPRVSIKHNCPCVLSLAFSPDGKTLAIGHMSRNPRIPYQDEQPLVVDQGVIRLRPHDFLAELER